MTDPLSSIQSLTNQVGAGVNTVKRLGADLGLGGIGSAGTYWKDRLRPASFRGVPFGVLGGSSQFGRRSIVHEYPFRDTVWVEDLGRSARRITIQGFLVGDDCIAQRDRMIAACENAGDALLVHPTYGELTVSMIGSLSVREQWDRGRVFEIGFSFIESGARIFPSISTATGDAVSSAAAAADAAASGDFTSRAAAALKNGAAVVSTAVSSAATWGRTAQRLANDATNLRNMVGSLPGNLGRFAGGRNSGGLGGSVSKLAGSATTVKDLLALGSRARSGVASAASALSSAASGLGL